VKIEDVKKGMRVKIIKGIGTGIEGVVDDVHTAGLPTTDGKNTGPTVVVRYIREKGKGNKELIGKPPQYLEAVSGKAFTIQDGEGSTENA
jgi:hypothetical protein